MRILPRTAPRLSSAVLVSMAEIDESVRRVADASKERLGLFDRSVSPRRNSGNRMRPSRIAGSSHADVGATQQPSMMLKNDKAALPLIGSLRRLAVIGPLADEPAEMRGPWWVSCDAEGHVSVVAGLRAVPHRRSQVLHAPGVAIDNEDVSG